MNNIIARSINTSKSARAWDLVFDGRYPVMSWKHKPSIIQCVAFCIYFLWT